MSRVADKYTFFRPGLRPTQYVVKRLQRFHPQIRVVWNWAVNRWVLMEPSLIDGELLPVMVIQTRDGEYRNLSMQDVWVLGEIDMRTKGYWDKQEWLEQLDHGHEEAAEKEKRELSRSMSEDLVDRVWFESGRKRGVLVNGSAPHNS